MSKLINIKKLIPKRSKEAHKGECGEVLIVAASPGMTGAGVLSARAALRSGAGLVKLAVPESLLNFVDSMTPEIITYGLPETYNHLISEKAAGNIFELSEKADVIAIGPGLSQSIITEKITAWKKAVVIDADGLNSLCGKTEVLMKFTGSVVITPHPGELSRLLQLEVREIQKNRVRAAKQAAEKWGVICVLKGAGTVIAEPTGKVSVNQTGNSGMATAGIGDVLTGMISSFIAQGVSPYDAAKLGVYLHGLAGDLALKSKGVHGLIASDVISAIPPVILKCLKK